MIIYLNPLSYYHQDTKVYVIFKQKIEMEYAFMQNPETEFSYEIKDMELNIRLIKKF